MTEFVDESGILEQTLQHRRYEENSKNLAELDEVIGDLTLENLLIVIQFQQEEESSSAYPLHDSTLYSLGHLFDLVLLLPWDSILRDSD